MNLTGELYKFIEKYSKRTGDIAGMHLDDLTHLPYKILKHTIPDLFSDNKLDEAITMILNNSDKIITLQQVKRLPDHERTLFLLWVKDQYTAIGNAEKKYWYSPPDAKMIRAGIHELDILGDINLIDNLAGGDVLKWEAIEMLPYEKIFNKQLKTTIEKRIEKNMRND